MEPVSYSLTTLSFWGHQPIFREIRCSRYPGQDFPFHVPDISANFYKLKSVCRYSFNKAYVKLELTNGFGDCISANIYGLSSCTVCRPLIRDWSVLLGLVQLDYKQKPEGFRYQYLVPLSTDYAYM